MSPEKVITEALRGLVGGPGFLADTAVAALRAAGYAIVATRDVQMAAALLDRWPTTAGIRRASPALAQSLLAAADVAEVGVLPEQESGDGGV